MEFSELVGVAPLVTIKMGEKDNEGASKATAIYQAVSAIGVLKFLFGKKTILKIRKNI